MKQVPKHLLVFTLLLFVGCEITGLIMFSGNPELTWGGYRIAFLGIYVAWPTLILASIYTEYIRRKSDKIS